MIRYISFSELGAESFYAENIECHRQIWGDGSKWTGYSKKMRFADGLSFICSSVEATYILPDGTKITARYGDAVYIPHESLYTVSFKNGGRETDIYTVNFLLKDKDGNGLRLGHGIEVYRGAASCLCLETAGEIADAFLFSGSNLKKQALLMHLLDLLSGHFEKHSESLYPIRRGVALLIEEWNKNERIARYAEVCGISERAFYLCFKRWSGKTPVDYRNEIRITAARSMLSSSDLSVSEIAFRTGFDDPYYFSRVFKKSVGMPPKMYRKSI